MLADRVGLGFRAGPSGWTKPALKERDSWVKQAPDGVPSGPWQRLLKRFLPQLEHLESRIHEADQVIAGLRNEQRPIEQVREIPGVGPLTGAALVAVIDDPRRFQNGKQVSRYSGFDPVPYESGKQRRTTGISRRNWATFRNDLYEACMVGIHRLKDPWMRRIYEHIAHTTGSKRKAVCAVARRVFVKAWRMLRYDQDRTSVTGGHQVTAE
jgi:transposase